MAKFGKILNSIVASKNNAELLHRKTPFDLRYACLQKKMKILKQVQNEFILFLAICFENRDCYMRMFY